MSYVTVTFAPVNQRRYMKPWGALITAWNPGEKPEHLFSHGTYEQVEIVCKEGDVIRYGQKDMRRPNLSERQYAIVVQGTDGLVYRPCTEAEACKTVREQIETTTMEVKQMVKSGTHGAISVQKVKASDGQIGWQVRTPDDRENRRLKDAVGNIVWMPKTKAWFVPEAKETKLEKYLSVNTPFVPFQKI